MLHAPPPFVLQRLAESALEEDLGRGDLTTEALVPADLSGEAVFRARSPIVLCGLAMITAVYEAIDGSVEVRPERNDGDSLAAGDVAARVRGPARSILIGERIALNFAQRMSGVATMAKRYVDAVGDHPCRIADTRKTTPGLRPLERYAVRCGGAHNHRNDLSSAVMIKDNHIAACGGDTALAIRRARSYAPHTARIECEVDRFDQLEVALAEGADVIMLDNFDNDAVLKGVKMIRERATRPTVIEASGGITLERIPSLAALGIDVISVGALTHSVMSADIGLDWS